MSRRAILATLGVALAACGPLVLDEDLALGPLPPLPVRETEGDAAERIELGRLLFWDPVLSGDRDVACASCHHPDFGYADGRALALGAGARGLGPSRSGSDSLALLTRNSPTVLDTAYAGLARLGDPVVPEQAPMFWDARARSLEAQVAGPLLAAGEMRGDALREHDVWPVLVARLEAIDEYRARFTRAFGSEGIDPERIAAAIADFERTLVIRESRFDRFLAGDDTALDLSEQRGLVTFFAAGCAGCHSGPMFSDYALHDIGVGEVDPATGARPRFRTPSLRSAALTAPYMHDGSIATLEGAVLFYTGLDPALDEGLAGNQPLGSSAANDIARFLASLADGEHDTHVPGAVPSGLPVGGAIAP